MIQQLDHLYLLPSLHKSQWCYSITLTLTVNAIAFYFQREGVAMDNASISLSGTSIMFYMVYKG